MKQRQKALSWLLPFCWKGFERCRRSSDISFVLKGRILRHTEGWIVRHGFWKCLDLLWPVRCQVESWYWSLCRWGLWRSCCYACGGILDWRHESTNFMGQSPWPLEIFPKFLSPLSNVSMWFIRCSTLKNLSSPCFFGYPLFSRFLSSNVIRSTFALASGLGYSEKLSQRAQALEVLSRQTFMLSSFPRSLVRHVLPGQASISQLPSSRPRFLPLNCGTPIEILQASKSGVLASASSKMTSFLVEGRINEDDHSTKHSTFSEFVSPNSHQPINQLPEAVMVGVDVFELTYPMEAKLTKRCVLKQWQWHCLRQQMVALPCSLIGKCLQVDLKSMKLWYLKFILVDGCIHGFLWKKAEAWSFQMLMRPRNFFKQKMPS